MIDPSQLSPAAIVVATIVGAGLGAAWYSPILLGNAWMAAIGKTEEELTSPGPAIAGSVAACLVSATVVDAMVAATGVASLAGGLGLGALLGIGLVGMAMLSDSLFSGWGTRLYLIQAGYRVLYLILMGGVSGAFR